ncbi:MAG: dihydrofolate reductase family protein, partial [Microbacteriaceae bacterium]
MEPIHRTWPLPAVELDQDGLIDCYRVADRSAPWLRVNFVMSADGAATEDGLSGGLSSASDKKVFGILRRLCDVVLVGAGTVRIEGYGAMTLGDASAAWRAEHGLPPQPVFAIVSGSLDL